MTIPGYQTLMLPLLKLADQGEVALQDAVDRLAEEFRLSPEEAAQRLASGQRVIYNRTGWAKTELVKAGLIEQPRRGLFSITARGRELLATLPTSIDRAFLAERYPEFRAYLDWAQQRQPEDGQVATVVSTLGAAPVVATPDEQIDTAAKTLNTALEADILARIRGVAPEKFEQLVVDLLVAMKFGGGDPDMGQRLGRAGDGGIDGVIQGDALGLDAVYIQANATRTATRLVPQPFKPSLAASLGSERQRASL